MDPVILRAPGMGGNAASDQEDPFPMSLLWSYLPRSGLLQDDGAHTSKRCPWGRQSCKCNFNRQGSRRTMVSKNRLSRQQKTFLVQEKSSSCDRLPWCHLTEPLSVGIREQRALLERGIAREPKKFLSLQVSCLKRDTHPLNTKHS